MAHGAREAPASHGDSAPAPARAGVSPQDTIPPAAKHPPPRGSSPLDYGPMEGQSRAHTHRSVGTHPVVPGRHMVGDGFPESVPHSHPKMPLSYKMAEFRPQSSWDGRLVPIRSETARPWHRPHTATPAQTCHARMLMCTWRGPEATAPAQGARRSLHRARPGGLRTEPPSGASIRSPEWASPCSSSSQQHRGVRAELGGGESEGCTLGQR